MVWNIRERSKRFSWFLVCVSIHMNFLNPPWTFIYEIHEHISMTIFAAENQYCFFHPGRWKLRFTNANHYYFYAISEICLLWNPGKSVKIVREFYGENCAWRIFDIFKGLLLNATFSKCWPSEKKHKQTKFILPLENQV